MEEKFKEIDKVISMLTSTDKEMHELGKASVKRMSLRDVRYVDQIKLFLLFRDSYGRHKCRRILYTIEKKIEIFEEICDFYEKNSNNVDLTHFNMIQDVFINTKKCRKYFVNDIPAIRVEWIDSRYTSKMTAKILLKSRTKIDNHAQK